MTSIIDRKGVARAALSLWAVSTGAWFGAGVLTLFVMAHSYAAWEFYNSFPGSWSWTELLVDYQGGFVKRGLLGDIAFHLQGLISARNLLVAIVATAYVGASATFVVIMRLTDEFPGVLFLLSPLGWLFPLLVPAAYGRKDIFVIAAVAVSLTVVRRCTNKNGALAATMATFALTGLVVEIAWFYFPLVFGVWLVRWRGESLRRRLSTLAVAVVYTLGCLVLTLFQAPVDTVAIAASWHNVPFDAPDTGALCCLNYSFDIAVATAEATLPNLPDYGVAAAFGAIPLLLLLARRPIVGAGWLAPAILAAGAISSSFPLFVAADWGRYIYLCITTVFLAVWTAGRLRPTQGRVARDDVYAMCMKACFICLYSTTWQTVQWQHTDLSALVPGALFRAMGVYELPPWAK